MKKFNFFALAISALLAGCVSGASDSGFTSLFDGKSLNGWTLMDKKGDGYVVKDGTLICPSNGGGNLFTERQYTDFVLRLDFKLSPGGNNGVAIRSPMSGGQIAYVGNEIQVLDDASPEYANLKYGQNCGSLYRVFEAKRGAVKKAGEWNRYEITAIGRRITVVLNGKKIVDGNVNDVHDAETLQRHPGLLRERGRIGFLGHNSHVEFRNIRIKELPHYFERDNVAPAGFTALFNGRDLNGWKGLVADPIKRAKMSPQNSPQNKPRRTS